MACWDSCHENPQVGVIYQIFSMIKVGIFCGSTYSEWELLSHISLLIL